MTSGILELVDPGARQGSCRLNHVVPVRLSRPRTAASITASPTGHDLSLTKHSVTGSYMRTRDIPLHRLGSLRLHTTRVASNGRRCDTEGPFRVMQSMTAFSAWCTWLGNAAVLGERWVIFSIFRNLSAGKEHRGLKRRSSKFVRHIVA